MQKPTYTVSQLFKPNKKNSIPIEKLSASEIRYRRLFESEKDGILVLDTETGKIVNVNLFLTELLCYTKLNQ